MLLGIKFNEFIITTEMKNIIKYGMRGVLLFTSFIKLSLYEINEIHKTTGNRSVTLNNFIKVAVSPVKSDTVNPAPTT